MADAIAAGKMAVYFCTIMRAALHAQSKYAPRIFRYRIPATGAIASGVPAPLIGPAAVAPLRPQVNHQSAVLIPSRLCSITRIDPLLQLDGGIAASKFANVVKVKAGGRLVEDIQSTELTLGPVRSSCVHGPPVAGARQVPCAVPRLPESVVADCPKRR